MPDVIQELVGEDVIVDYAHVHARVEDWKRRLANLYSDVVSWLPNLTSDQQDVVEMNEEMMRKFGVSPTKVPVLRLFRQQDQIAKFVPRGLWIIGANGRLDVFALKGQYVIVDRSEYFTPPRWEIAPSLQRLKTEPLSRDTLLQAVQ